MNIFLFFSTIFMWSSSEIWKNRVWLKKDWQLTNFRPFSTRPYNWYRCINWKDLSLSIQTKLGGNEVCASWSLLFPQLSSLPLPSHFFYRNHLHVFDVLAWKLKVFYNGFGGVWVIPVSPPYCFAHPDLVNERMYNTSIVVQHKSSMIWMISPEWT